MGHGSYTSADWTKLKNSSKISSTSTASQLFKVTNLQERFDPRFINFREARDSQEHPNSTPIIIGLDVTGSMGYLSASIAKEGLNETMMKLYATNVVPDPQIMFAAVGDISDHAPLQVTQFESDIRIAEQLLNLWLEGAGGDGPEDYPLLWYFADRHVAADAIDKRGKKGFLFTIGDADCHKNIPAHAIKRIFADETGEIAVRDLARKALQKYEVFHIHIQKSYLTRPPVLQETLPGRILTITPETVKYLPEIIISTMKVVNGTKLEEAVAQWSELARPVVRNAMSNLVVKQDKKGLSF